MLKVIDKSLRRSSKPRKCNREIMQTKRLKKQTKKKRVQEK